MKLGTLIEILNDYQETHGDNIEVRLMTQQNWPFENSICGIASSQDIAESRDDDENEDDRTEPDDDDEQKDAVIYVVEGRQICYGDKTAWDVARDC